MKLITRIVTLTLIEEMLGTKPADPQVFSSYIASKHPDGSPQRDELESADRSEIQGTTGFHKDDQGPFIYDYQIRGFFKESAGFMRQVGDSQSSHLTAYKSKIDGLVFVNPRKIRLILPEGQTLGISERPLRAETQQGPRTALVRSETVPAGTVLKFEVQSLVERFKGKGEKSVLFDDLLLEWLSYGALHGLGQWRNSGKGKFVHSVVDTDGQELTK